MSKKRKYGPRVPRYATGIRLQEIRSGGNRSWWAKAWTERVTAMQFGARTGLAKSYAMAGQVIALEREGGVVTAKVMGARPEAYEVKLDFRQASGAAKARIEARLKAEPMLVARMLAGELPMEVEEAFRAEGLSLFPGGKVEEAGRNYDVEIGCSCPDWANPCKHATAALLILGERLAARPIEYLALRGVGGDEGQGVRGEGREVVVGSGSGSGSEEKKADQGDPPSLKLRRTGRGEVNGGGLVRGEVLERLGTIPGWRGEKRILPELEKIYSTSMKRAEGERRR